MVSSCCESRLFRLQKVLQLQWEKFEAPCCYTTQLLLLMWYTSTCIVDVNDGCAPRNDFIVHYELVVKFEFCHNPHLGIIHCHFISNVVFHCFMGNFWNWTRRDSTFYSLEPTFQMITRWFSLCYCISPNVKPLLKERRVDHLDVESDICVSNEVNFWSRIVTAPFNGSSLEEIRMSTKDKLQNIWSPSLATISVVKCPVFTKFKLLLHCGTSSYLYCYNQGYIIYLFTVLPGSSFTYLHIVLEMMLTCWHLWRELKYTFVSGVIIC